jgi:hypothetical protein
VTALVVVLALTNVVTLAVLTFLVRRPHSGGDLTGAELPPDTAVIVSARPAGLTSRTRRVITVEILNPMELVNTRGRVASLAGSLAPGFARRVVYDQTLKVLRRELAEKQVLADVKLHTLHATPKQASKRDDSVTRQVATYDEVELFNSDSVGDSVSGRADLDYLSTTAITELGTFEPDVPDEPQR